MKRYQLSEYLESARREEGMTLRETTTVVEELCRNERDRSGWSVRRWTLPLLLLLLVVGGHFVTRTLQDASEQGTGTAQATYYLSPEDLYEEEDRVTPIDSITDTADRTDETTTPWGYRLQPGDRLRYEKAVLFDEVDWNRKREYREWAEIAVERVNARGEITFVMHISDEKNDTSMICRGTMSRTGRLLSTEMIYDPEEIEWRNEIMSPSFGGGGRVLPSLLARREIERWIPKWQSRESFGPGTLTFTTDSVRYDTSRVWRLEMYNDPEIHGDTIGNIIYYSSAKARGITDDMTWKPWKFLRPGVTESRIDLVPIVTSGNIEEEEPNMEPSIDTATERHTYHLLSTEQSPFISWSDHSIKRQGQRGHVWEVRDTLRFRRSDGLLVTWVHTGASRGPRGTNTLYERRVRLVGRRLKGVRPALR